MTLTSNQTAAVEHAAKEVMHQSALFALDVGAGRSRGELARRIEVLKALLSETSSEIERLPDGRYELRQAYWDAFNETRQSVCLSCAFRRPDEALVASMDLVAVSCEPSQ